MSSSHNPFQDIEDEISDEDMAHCQEQLKKPDRIGKYAVWICVILFAVAGWFIVDGLIVDTPVHHPWYSKVPLVGEKLWTPPKSTQIPIVGKTIHDVGLLKFCGLCIGVIMGFLVGKIISFLIRNGARQDERNQRKHIQGS